MRHFISIRQVALAIGEWTLRFGERAPHDTEIKEVWENLTGLSYDNVQNTVSFEEKTQNPRQFAFKKWTSCADPAKHYVFVKTNEEEVTTITHFVLALTRHPERYGRGWKALRTFRGKSLIVMRNYMLADTWLEIANIVEECYLQRKEAEEEKWTF